MAIHYIDHEVAKRNGVLITNDLNRLQYS